MSLVLLDRAVVNCNWQWLDRKEFVEFVSSRTFDTPDLRRLFSRAMCENRMDILQRMKARFSKLPTLAIDVLEHGNEVAWDIFSLTGRGNVEKALESVSSSKLLELLEHKHLGCWKSARVFDLLGDRGMLAEAFRAVVRQTFVHDDEEMFAEFCISRGATIATQMDLQEILNNRMVRRQRSSLLGHLASRHHFCTYSMKETLSGHLCTAKIWSEIRSYGLRLDQTAVTNSGESNATLCCWLLRETRTNCFSKVTCALTQDTALLVTSMFLRGTHVVLCECRDLCQLLSLIRRGWRADLETLQFCITRSKDWSSQCVVAAVDSLDMRVNPLEVYSDGLRLTGAGQVAISSTWAGPESEARGRERERG